MPSTKHELSLLLEPEVLNNIISNHLDVGKELIILDFCQAQTYAAAHLPGAIHVPINRLNRGEKPAVGQLPTNEALSALMSDLGVTHDAHIVCYDDEGGGWAGRFIWMLDVIGHLHKSYLNGGIRAWLASGYDTERTPRLAEPASYEVEVNDRYLVNKEYVLAHLDSEEVVIWDARSPEEFSGERVFAKKAGHIPGAINYEWTRAMDINNNLKMRPLDEIREELASLGITASKKIITHCQTHHRSGFTYLVGRVLGFKQISAYAGSWSEWGNADNTPVET